VKKYRLASITGLLAIVLVFNVNAAHAAAGSLDPTFGNGGIVITPSGGGVVEDAVLQADGKIVVQGSFGVARFLSDGAVDTSFGTGGFAQAPASANFGAVALQSDGKILVAGVGNSLTGMGFAVTRLNTNGSLDTTFGGSGTVIANLGSPNIGEAILQQPDGKILLGGTLIERIHYHTVLIRYNLDGSLDQTFGSGGIVNVLAVNGVTQLALDIAGDIFVNNSFLIAEFSHNGTLLPQVTPALLVKSSRGGSTTFLANGKYVFADTVYVGTPRNRDLDGHVVRFTATGAIDSTFNSPTFDFEGEGGSGQFDTLRSVAIQSNGQLVVGGGHGVSSGGNIPFGLARFNLDGSFDSTFGNGGIVNTDISGNQGASALLIQSDGKIVAIGGDNSGGLALARYLAQ
jgi:uncharacterized delta-60 repeat protein